MSNSEELLKLAEELISQEMGYCLSELQHTILRTALQGKRITYDQIAQECGYSAKYVKQDVAPKLWQLLSQALQQKITKANVRVVLGQEILSRPQKNIISLSPPTELPLITSTVCQGNILLVDDHPENLQLLSDLLEEQGYDVRQAITGMLALRTIQTKFPDVILLDINMPDLDGYTICQRIKTNPDTAGISVIFVSALDEAWDKVKSFSVGADDYITKPFNTVEVLARVKNQIKIARVYQELQQTNRQLQEALAKLNKLQKYQSGKQFNSK